MRFLLLFAALPLLAQRDLSGTAQIELALDRLNTVGSVLMIAAHPDDENTALLAYFARGRHLRTGYLSLTRGEGGQNLIGSEQGDLMGVIRTQELLAARRIDGAEQFFSRAIDFGFSKTADETLAKWGREQVLSDVVWAIRKFRPDVIVLRFSGTPRDGHGQHQSSAILGKEAFSAAADPKRFPEQLAYVQPWQARRLFFNLFSFNRQMEAEALKTPNRIEIDTGEFNPILGHSYTEIAGMSRSQHQSQGMGAMEVKGSQRQFLVSIAGDASTGDSAKAGGASNQAPFDSIDLTWNRIPNGAPVGAILAEARAQFQPAHPEALLPLLAKARALLAPLAYPDARRKLAELDETIALCAGLWVDATATHYAAVPGSPVSLKLSAVERLKPSVEILGAALVGIDGAPSWTISPETLPYNQPKTYTLDWTLPPATRYSQPYWLAAAKQGALYGESDVSVKGLAEAPAPLRARVRLKVDGTGILLLRPVRYRYVDRVRGELTRPIAIVPPAAVSFSEPTLLFPSRDAKTVEVMVKANQPNLSGVIRPAAPQGWKIDPPTQPYTLKEAGEETVLRFQVTPPASDTTAELSIPGAAGMTVIAYPHIPPQTLFPPAKMKLVRADVKLLTRNVGYIMGAGDEMPVMIRQMGATVTLLTEDDLSRGDLSRFDAIVAGVRAYNTRADLRANHQHLMSYVENGGAYIVQYNTQENPAFGGDPSLLKRIGPYPLTVGNSRVTVEEAPVAFPNPDHPALQMPNHISARDFEGWVQERGLYFASQWDSRYQPLFRTNDPGESPQEGGTLYARYGKGVYIFTAFAWFRQLPAGVPGSFRLFANFLSAAKLP